MGIEIDGSTYGTNYREEERKRFRDHHRIMIQHALLYGANVPEVMKAIEDDQKKLYGVHVKSREGGAWD